MVNGAPGALARRNAEDEIVVGKPVHSRTPGAGARRSGLSKFLRDHLAALRNPNIFIPEISVLCDKAAHHLHTFRIIKHPDRNTCLSK